MDFLSIIYNTFFVNANEILPGLWLGNAKAALDNNFLIDNNIDIIVNCTTDIPFINETQIETSYDDIIDSSSVKTKTINIRIPVNDSLLEKDILLMQHYLTVLLPELLEYYNSDKKIFVHCYAGKQRSAIVIASLLFSLRVSELSDTLSKEEIAKDVFKFIISKRPQAFTYGLKINFIKTFNRLFDVKL